jgi:hypothetical protein
MPNLALAITGVVEGDDFTLTLGITEIPAGDALSVAYFTMKESIDDPDPGLFQKVITASNTPGTGQIEDDGWGDGAGIVRIDLVPADTVLPAPGVAAVWDLQVHTALGLTNTPYKGTFTTVQGVTDATL